MMKKNLGITLIELMVVVVIVAIIASIAYPSYREQVNKTRRSDAKAALMDATARMERHYTQFGRYSGTIANSGISGTSPENFYTITATVAAGASQTFTVTATRAGQQAGDNCGDFGINQAQTRLLANNTYTPVACDWQ